ncbi:hypothetical protein E4U45_007146 [Claviceps purpurea]|nr:hypothetical protein E4U45_007146 [Claviceps purpurea]
MYEALLSLRLQRVQPPESKKSITLHSCRPKACTISSLDAVFKFIQGWPIENGVALIKQTTSACRDIGNNSEKVPSYFDLSVATEESLSEVEAEESDSPQARKQTTSSRRAPLDQHRRQRHTAPDKFAARPELVGDDCAAVGYGNLYFVEYIARLYSDPEQAFKSATLTLVVCEAQMGETTSGAR